MIYMKLFFSFLMIGALSFGGGYGMVSLVKETVLSNGWLSESEFMNFIAVSESTPGPLAINMATFIGSTQGRYFGITFCNNRCRFAIVHYNPFNLGGLEKSFEIFCGKCFFIRRTPLYCGYDSCNGKRYGIVIAFGIC